MARDCSHHTDRGGSPAVRSSDRCRLGCEQFRLLPRQRYRKPSHLLGVAVRRVLGAVRHGCHRRVHRDRVQSECRGAGRSANLGAEGSGKGGTDILKRHKRKLFKKMEQAKNEVEKRADETKGKIDAVGNDAKRDIETAASGAKKELLNTLTKEANEATDQITTTRDEIIAAMDKVRGDVERKGDEATQAIAVAQQEAQRQIDQTVGGSREGESEGKPE